MATGSFEATKDLHISSKSQDRDTPYGAESRLLLEFFQYALETYSKRVLLQFDFSTIAKGSTVSGATLTLTATGLLLPVVYANSFEVYRLTYDGWTEQATWNHQNGANVDWPGSYTGTPRTGARNDFNPIGIPVATFIQPSRMVAIGNLSGWIQDAINENDGILSLYMYQGDTPTIVPNPLITAAKEHATVDPPTIAVTWAPPTRALTITESPDAGGSIIVTTPNSYPQGVAVESGTPIYVQNNEVATITVTDAEGYGFNNWTGTDSGDVGGAGPYTITMDADKAIQANWDVTTYRLILNEGTNGTDTPAPTGGSPLHTYDVDSDVVLTWIPDALYQLDALTIVQGDTPSGGAVAAVQPAPKDNFNIQTTLTIDQLKEITSTYKLLHTVTVNTAGGANGTVTAPVILGAIGWDQYPKFAYFDRTPYGGEGGAFFYFIRAVPDAGYVVQVTASTGTIERWTQLVPFGVDHTYYKFTPADANCTITVTWVAIHADQAIGGPWQKPWNEQPWRIH